MGLTIISALKRLRQKGFFKTRLTPRYLRLKFGSYNLYIAHHAMQPIQFEKQQRKKKRRKLRGRLLDRAGHKCEICGCELDWKTISPHNVKRRLTHPELEFDLDNLMALCHDCHARLHEIERLKKLNICPI